MKNKYSLQGLTFLVTRPKHQAKELVKAIKAAGGYTVLLPTITIADAVDQESLQRALVGFGNADIIIFTSANAVFKSAALIHYYWPQLPEKLHIVPIGSATLKALNKEKISAKYLPESFNSEGLLALPLLEQVAGKSILIIKGEGGRTLLSSVLKERGARVSEVIAYRRIRPHKEENFWLKSKKAIDIAICTSSEGLQNLFTMVGKTGTQYLQKIPFVVISNRMANTARQLGIKQFWVANNVTVTAIMSAIIKGRSETMSNSSDHSETSRNKQWSFMSLTNVSGIVSILLGLFILLMVFGIYQEINKQQQRVLSTLEILQQSIKQDKQVIEMMRTEMSHLQTQLQEQRSTLQNTQSELQQKLGSTRNLTEQTVTETVYLIHQAMLALNYDRNVPGAISLLQAADQRLQAINNAGLAKLRQAIANTVAQLQAIPVPDMDGLLARLSALQQQVNELPLFVTPTTIKPMTEDTAKSNHSSLTGWRKAMMAGWDSLQQLVVIRRHNSPVAPLVPPEQEVYLRQYVQLQLQQAQWAAIHAQANTYRASLAQASHWVSHYFAQDAVATRAMLAALNELQAINVNPTLPDISSALSDLKQLGVAQTKGEKS